MDHMAETSKILDYRDPEWVGKRLGLDKNTVYKFLQDGVIPAVHLGRKWLISEARLIEWLEKEAESQTRARREATQWPHPPPSTSYLEPAERAGPPEIFASGTHGARGSRARQASAA